MSDYRLTATDIIVRTADGASIPPDPDNRDYADYLAWVEAGGVADPYDEPPPAPPAAEDQLLFDHENRLRALEGQPPISQDEFTAMKGG